MCFVVKIALRFIVKIAVKIIVKIAVWRLLRFAVKIVVKIAVLIIHNKHNSIFNSVNIFSQSQNPFDTMNHLWLNEVKANCTDDCDILSRIANLDQDKKYYFTSDRLWNFKVHFTDWSDQPEPGTAERSSFRLTQTWSIFMMGNFQLKTQLRYCLQNFFLNCILKVFSAKRFFSSKINERAKYFY